MPITKHQYLKYSERYNLIPVFETINSDLETPMSVFLKTDSKILLESVDRGELTGRYSFIGKNNLWEIRINNNEFRLTGYNEEGKLVSASEQTVTSPVDSVKEWFSDLRVPEINELPPFYGGLMGYMGYENIGHFESVDVKPNSSDIPDSLMVIPRDLIIHDSVKQQIHVITLSKPGKNPENSYFNAEARVKELVYQIRNGEQSSPDYENGKAKSRVKSSLTEAEYIEMVKKGKDYIKEGDAIQIVLSQKFSVDTDENGINIYRNLRSLNPSPYMFYIDFEDFSVIGSSPEVMVKVTDNELMLKPIAGTRRRGASPEEDRKTEAELLKDRKECAEHLMLVDLGRNDLGRVAEPGSVKVEKLMKTEYYSHVIHIVSTISARLTEEQDVFDTIRATFPAGTLTGAPKVRAMQIIEELENSRRGIYGGMVFTLGFNNNLNSCIAIRTMVLKDGTAHFQAGAGIVADSVPEKEYRECLDKAGALVHSLNAEFPAEED